jgi:hypothetical protein
MTTGAGWICCNVDVLFYPTYPTYAITVRELEFRQRRLLLQPSARKVV